MNELDSLQELEQGAADMLYAARYPHLPEYNPACHKQIQHATREKNER